MKAALRSLLRLFRKETSSILKPRRYGFIDDIYVAPTMRNNPVGVGVKLYRSSLSWFELRRVNHLQCSINAGKKGVQVLSRKFGFKTVAVLMSMNLSNRE